MTLNRDQSSLYLGSESMISPAQTVQTSGGRPTVKPKDSVSLLMSCQWIMLISLKPPKFYANDQVWLSDPSSRGLLGPYRISYVDTSTIPPQYTLSQVDGTPWNDGRSVREAQLQLIEQ